MKPNTLKILSKIWAFRAATDSQVCFTLDAGANVHLLYPKQELDTVRQFIKDELLEFCQNSHAIHDEVGNGAKQMDLSN
jgi:diphosphomevalonate decarboxylase